MSFLTRHLIRRYLQVRSSHTDLASVKRKKNLPVMRSLLDSNLNLITLLNSNEPITPNDWETAREQLMNFDFVNGKSLDATITNLCISLQNTDAFISYMRFLKENNHEINLYIAAKYAEAFKKRKPTESEKQEICSLYDYVRKKYPILDGNTCDQFVNGLCQTDRWKDSLELLDMMKMYSNISPSSLNVIVVAAFRHGEEDIGWKLLTLGAEENILILPESYSAFLEYCLRTFKDEKALEKNILKMFQYCKESEKLMVRTVLDDYLTVLRNLGYTTTGTSISRLGHCAKCLHELLPAEISKEEFDEMSRLFMEKVLVGDNVYYNSSPKEYKQFMEFLEKAVPYDVVIDGLNVACVGHRDKDNKKRSERLATIVEHFLSEDKKILLLGRKHMIKWDNMNFIKHNTKMFLVNDSSFDDPYLLYATLYGGMNTKFLSMDLMRQHKFMLPMDKQKVFKRWQLSHQYMLNLHTVEVKDPVMFQPFAQEDENGWHVPYFAGKGVVAKDSYDTNTDWLCLRKSSK